MLSFFTYYADGTHPTRDFSRNIVIRDCTVENADRFLHYNYNNEQWQRGVPMTDITFERVRATGIVYPLSAYGMRGYDVKLALTMRDCSITFGKPMEEFIRGAFVGEINLTGVCVEGAGSETPLFRVWENEMPKIRVSGLVGIREEIEKGTGSYDVWGI